MAFPSGFSGFIPSGQTSRTLAASRMQGGGSSRNDNDSRRPSIHWSSVVHFIVVLLFIYLLAWGIISLIQLNKEKEYQGVIVRKYTHERRHKHYSEDYYYVTLLVDSISRNIQVRVTAGTFHALQPGDRARFDMSINSLRDSDNDIDEHLIN